MELGEITDEIRKHYDWQRRLQDEVNLPGVMADAVRDLLGRSLKAEFFQYHDKADCRYWNRHHRHAIQTIPCDDLRHQYDDRAWLDAAGRVLTKAIEVKK